jgi:hypothetical protein
VDPKFSKILNVLDPSRNVGIHCKTQKFEKIILWGFWSINLNQVSSTILVQTAEEKAQGFGEVVGRHRKPLGFLSSGLNQNSATNLVQIDRPKPLEEIFQIFESHSGCPHCAGDQGD